MLANGKLLRKPMYTAKLEMFDIPGTKPSSFYNRHAKTDMQMST